jgi:integrase
MAAMTGLRQGELLGLRWGDLDGRARKVRVRQPYVRGEFKAPKSRRGTRGVPVAPSLEEARSANRLSNARVEAVNAQIRLLTGERSASTLPTP